MELRPLSPALGVEVAGVDLRRGVDAADLARLLAAYDERHLLLLRDQDLDEATQERFVATFGPLVDDLRDGHRSGAITNVGDDGGGSGPLPFHCDLSFTRSPVLGIALYAVEVPEGGTSTWFANAALAWRTLPDDVRARVEGRGVRHVLPLSTNRRELRAREHESLPGEPEATHALPLRHPRTGDPVLYVTDLHAHSIVGLPAGEGRALVETLVSHVASPAHVYEHRWRPGDLVVWDNVALQHARADVSAEGPRTFRRTAMNEHAIVELLPELVDMGRPGAAPGAP